MVSRFRLMPRAVRLGVNLPLLGSRPAVSRREASGRNKAEILGWHHP